jgi:hypothetical protein
MHDDPEVVAAAWEIDALIRALEVDAAVHAALVARLADIDARVVAAARCDWRNADGRCLLTAGHSGSHATSERAW